MTDATQWTYEKHEDITGTSWCWFIASPDFIQPIAIITSDYPGNGESCAALIVRAVNSHTELVALATELAEHSLGDGAAGNTGREVEAAKILWNKEIDRAMKAEAERDTWMEEARRSHQNVAFAQAERDAALKDAAWQAEEREREMERYDALHKELDAALGDEAADALERLVRAKLVLSHSPASQP